MFILSADLIKNIPNSDFVLQNKEQLDWQWLQSKRSLRIPGNSFMLFGDKTPNSNEMKNERAAQCSVRVSLELSVTTVDAGTTAVKRRQLRNEVKRSMHNQILV